jgi:hypothetical protein
MYGRTRSCSSGWGVTALRGLVLAWSLSAGGGSSPTALAAEPHPAAARTAAPAAGIAPIEVSSVTIRPDGPAVPGARVRLEAEDGGDPSTRYHWEQIEGPPVEIADPSRPSVVVTLPSGADRVAFHLVTARGDLTRLIRVTVPIQSLTGATRPQPAGKVRADAGDDQVGLVGYRVTLNGSRSTPGDGRGARWIQVAGPALSGPEQKGAFYSFIPTGPGLHRFILVIAGDGQISEPDEVNVMVGYPPAGAPFAAPASGPNPNPNPNLAPSPTAGNAPEKPEAMLAARLPQLPNGPRVASDIADVLEAVAGRVSLYESFAMLESELGRRLDVVVPATPGERGLWSRGVFQPLAAYTAAELLPAGLDLRTPQGLQQALTPAQRERLHDHLLNLARTFRAASQAR